MVISLVAMATATLIFFLDVIFELIEARFSFTYFSGCLVDSLYYVHYVCLQRN